MAHTYVTSFVHTVFSTKGRQKLLTPDVRYDLWAYFGGAARTNRMTALAVGGVDDHAHALLSLPATMSIAGAVRVLKAGSSRWIHDTYPRLRSFAWQEGYGAFTVGRGQVDATVAYIDNQEAHHRTRSFAEEYLEFLRRNGVDYDERYLWD